MSDTTTQTAGQELIVRANSEMDAYRKQGAHVLAPITLQNIPPLHRPVVSAVFINPDPKAKEVYPQRGGGLSLSGIGWKKIADGMGMQIDDGRSGRVDDGRDPMRCEYRVVGYLKSQDGTWRKLIGDKEIRMENVIEELYESKRELVKKFLSDPKDAADFKAAYPDPEVYIQEKVRSEALQIKKHILARAQSGAFARMVKSIGIRETYTAEELKKPFVFPKLVFELDPNHPDDRAFLRSQGAGAIDQLYPQPNRGPQRPALDGPPIEPTTRQIEYFDVPSDNFIEHQPAKPPAQASTAAPPSTPATPPPSAPSSAPSPAEVLRNDFKASDPTGQKHILEQLIKRKNYQGKVKGDMLDWSPENRAGFFDRLIAMADAPVQTTARLVDELPFD